MDGSGKMTFNSGNIYEGEFSKGQKHGQGKLMFKASGDVYEGAWKNDKMTGKGQYLYAKESKTYVGDFVEGAPYGVGTMKCDEFFYSG